MISHELQVIGIHIPRTGMTSVEKALCGKDWWKIDPDSKHILASQAKTLYPEHWEGYFKFSFVRNPFDRLVSMLKFKKNMKIDPDCSFLEYLEYLGDRHHFTYAEWLGEEMDFVGKLENMEEDWAQLSSRLKVSTELPHAGKSERRPYREYYDAASRAYVEKLFGEDLKRYGYEF